MLAAAVALGIFVLDTATPGRFAVAVFYVVVVLLAGAVSRRRGILLIGAGCIMLTVLSYVLTHPLIEDHEALMRCATSVAAITITTVLVLRNERINTVLAERASLLDLTHDSVSVRDMSNVVTYWNKGAEGLYGWSRDEAVGQAMHDLLRAVFPAPLQDIMTSLLQDGRWEGELVHTKKDGSKVDMASRWYLQRDRHGRPVAILETNNDITERKRAEADVLRHRQELQLMIDSIPAMVWTSRSDGTPDYVSARWEKDGYSRVSILTDWRSVQHPEDRERLEAAQRTSLKDGAPLEIEHRMRREDGTYRWLLSRNVPRRDEADVIGKWYGVSFDIEDRKQAEQDLVRKEAFLTEAQRLTRTGSFTWKPVSGEIDWSEEAYRIWELDPAEKPVVDLITSRIHPDDDAIFRRENERAVREGEGIDFHFRCVMPGGACKHIHAVARARTADDGELEFLGAMVDVTAAKEAEEALRRAQSELAHVTRLTTLGELAASLAHEVNQPLAGIITHGEASLRWLGREKPDLNEVRSAVEHVISDGRRAADVIRKLRGLAKRAEVQPEPQDLGEILADTLALVQRELSSARVTLRFEPAPGLPPVLVDRVHLQQVVINLILNGIQAMEGIAGRPRELCVRTVADGPDQVRIEVRDNGVGIDAAAQERLFQPFFTTKTDGLGMGLSISRTIVEAHGGRIWASGHDAVGTTIHVALPTLARIAA